MFPYPSGDLHMGHAEVFALHDVVARYWWQRGYEVLNPMGFDSFGLPAENAAIRHDEHPDTYTRANIAKSIESCQKYAASFDWSRTFNTSDPEYYRWTQWLFLEFFKRGLAYRKNSPVNWCPNDQTVLANEQVVGGVCDRCGAEVTKKNLTQWYFKITDYAQELLDGLDELEKTWPDRVVTAQRNWIGRSEGAHVDFAIDRPATSRSPSTRRVPTRCSARPSWWWRPTRRWPPRLVHRRAARRRWRTTWSRSARRPRSTGWRPTGPRRASSWASRRPTRSTGDADPGLRVRLRAGRLRHRRDHGRARPGPARLGVRAVFDLPVIRTVQPPEPTGRASAFTGDGPAINSANDEIDLSGLGVAEAKSHDDRASWRARGAGRGTVNFRLRDWLISRQRYWGPPIPIIHCPVDGEVPVPEDQLPVTLPMLKGADLKPKGTSPLGGATEWVNVACPTCGGPATRDTDTMDTFVDSSWYMFRYCSPHETDRAFDSAKVNAWMPANLYVGGVEHAVLHLLYGRFFTKVLNDMGLVDFREPWSAQLNQGFVINQGKKMSKSLGNGVDLGDQLGAFGVDAVRLTLVFAGPPEDDIDWANMSPDGSLRFLQRAWRLSGDVTSEPGVDVVGRRPGAAAYDGADGARRRRAGRGLPLQRDGRPGDGAGQRHPQGHRLRLRPRRPGGARGDRGGGDPAVAGRALHGRGDVGAAGNNPSPPSSAPGGRPSTRRCWSRTRSPRSCRSGARSRRAWRWPRTSPRPTWRPPPWPTRACSGRSTARPCAR